MEQTKDYCDDIINLLSQGSIAKVGSDPLGRSIYLDAHQVGAIVCAALAMRRELESRERAGVEAVDRVTAEHMAVALATCAQNPERRGVATMALDKYRDKYPLKA